MGNYYEGTLNFYLQELPTDIKGILINVSNGKPISDKLKAKIKWLQHSRWDYPSYEFYSLQEMGYEDDAISCGAKYLFTINFCMKGYLSDFDLGQAIADYLAPYAVNDQMCSPGYIGHISDEDSTYYKDFYQDYAALEEEQNKRAYLCKGCEFSCKWENSLCGDYEKCKRAYDKGSESI